MADAPPRRAFFTATDRGYLPHPEACSPWSTEVLHGRLLAGLAAGAIERAHGAVDLVPTRLTVDLFRSAPMGPVRIDTTVVRDGGRVRVVDATARVDGRDVARASVLLLRTGEPVEDDAPVVPSWDGTLPDPDRPLPEDLPFDMQVVDGRGVGEPGPRQVWFREHRPLVADDDLTPFVRAALVADMASPVANSSSAGLDYINSDLTLYLGRLPRGDWLGLEAAGRVVGAGTTAAQCRLHDLEGPVGWSSMGAVRNPRMVPRLMTRPVDE
jgi:hypothetical protein